MRVYRHKRETLEGSFSLVNTELRVGEISDSKGNRFKGISLYGGLHGPLVGADRAIVLDDHHARDLLDFLDRIQQQAIPAHFSVSMNWFETFTWDVSKFLPDWHDGGSLSGRLGVRALLGVGIVPAIITMNTANRLRHCIADFYGISR